MMPGNLKVFLDTSVIISAVLSLTGGARQVFYLGEAGVLDLIVGPSVLREADEVVRRKIPDSLPMLAQLLFAGQVTTSRAAMSNQIKNARACVEYAPDAFVLAEAMAAQPDWFITHDKEHFLKPHNRLQLSFKVSTPGDLIAAIKERYRSS
jgi:predicted nucleic acid-binding protein